MLVSGIQHLQNTLILHGPSLLPAERSSDTPCSNPLHLQVSVGGRDNFLAAESDKTLTMMVDSCSETKVAQALLAHAQHKSPQVRAKIGSHLDSLLQGETGLRLASEILCSLHPYF